MKRCPVCNRTYTDESLNFCADDGTQLVRAPTAEPVNEGPSSLPTLVAPPQFTPPPPASSYQPTRKKRKWLGLIALVFGFLAVPFLLYSLSQPLLREFAFRNAHFSLLFIGLWGAVTTIGFLLASVSVVAAIVALGVSFKKPAQYGGRLMAVAGSVLSVLLVVLVIGAFAFRRLQGPTYFASDSSYNPNSNYNSNRSDNFNSDEDAAANTNSDDNYNSSSSDSAADSTGMSETDKYRLFYAATKSADIDLQRRAARKIGIVDSSGMPTSTYQSFVKGTVNWAMADRAWVRTMDTTAKGRAYAEERLGTTP
jgi:hypothetical protein